MSAEDNKDACVVLVEANATARIADEMIQLCKSKGYSPTASMIAAMMMASVIGVMKRLHPDSVVSMFKQVQETMIDDFLRLAEALSTEGQKPETPPPPPSEDKPN